MRGIKLLEILIYVRWCAFELRVESINIIITNKIVQSNLILSLYHRDQFEKKKSLTQSLPPPLYHKTNGWFFFFKKLITHRSQSIINHFPINSKSIETVNKPSELRQLFENTTNKSVRSYRTEWSQTTNYKIFQSTNIRQKFNWLCVRITSSKSIVNMWANEWKKKLSTNKI